MSESVDFAGIVLLVSGVAVVAVLSNRLTALTRIPAPAFFLAGAAVAVSAFPDISSPPHQTVERLVTVALLCILFEGGMHIGLHRFRAAAGPIVVVGVVGTFLVTGAVALLAHLAFGFTWYASVLIGTAVAPTDPALVFSVLGQRVIAGRSSTILEGESGANDPVGIALLASLLAAGSLSGSTLLDIAGEFVLQMAVGAASGVAGGWALLAFMRRVALPSGALHPLRTLASIFALYGATTLCHGSGFLAVFVAGIVIGDERAPFKREVEQFHAALSSLGEIVAFIVLGLTVDLDELSHADVLVPGLVIGVVLSAVIRPALVGLCLLPARLQRNEAVFVLFAGLKGAVPILLGSLILTAPLADSARLYGIVVVVVALSVLVQGSLVPVVAQALHLPMRTVEPQPWALGVRLRDEPSGVLRLQVEPGSAADGRTVSEVAQASAPEACADEVWVSMLVRDSVLLQVRGQTRLQAGDDLLLTAAEGWHEGLMQQFRSG